jgi:hypothetical protein
MTDRFKGLYVVFETDIGPVRVQQLIDAIKLYRGVLDVTADAATLDDYANRRMVRAEFEEKLFSVLRDPDDAMPDSRKE